MLCSCACADSLILRHNNLDPNHSPNLVGVLQTKLQALTADNVAHESSDDEAAAHNDEEDEEEEE